MVDFKADCGVQVIAVLARGSRLGFGGASSLEGQTIPNLWGNPLGESSGGVLWGIPWGFPWHPLGAPLGGILNVLGWGSPQLAEMY